MKKKNDDSKNVLMLGGEVEEATAGLRIFGDDLDPNELTQLLSCQPTEAYKKGHIVTTTIRPRTIKTGQWFLRIKRNKHQALEEQILELFERMTSDLEVWQEINNRFKASIYCGAWLKGWNRDVFFSTNLLKQMADRKLELGIAIYCDCDDEEVEVLTRKLNETGSYNNPLKKKQNN